MTIINYVQRTDTDYSIAQQRSTSVIIPIVPTSLALSSRNQAFYFPLYPAVAILILAWAVRTAPLTQNRFHPDEAWYAHFARLIASGRDPWLGSVTVDKPPLPFYLSAASLILLAPIHSTDPIIAEFSTRLPSLLASMLSAALAYRLARNLYSVQTGLLTALAFALSPLPIAFSTTLFTDTLLTTFILWSLWMAARRSWGWSGTAFALALTCKQTALFFLPLVLVLGLIRSNPPTFDPSHIARTLIRWLIPILAATLILFLWDTLRSPEANFWQQGYADNNPRRFIRSNELNPRFRELTHLSHYFTGSSVANIIMLGGSLALAVTAYTHRARRRSAGYDLLIIAFVLAYLGTYWLLAFSLWDRYILSLAPLVSMLLARIATRARMRNHRATASWWHPYTSNVTTCILLTSLIPPAFAAANSQLPIGGDHGAYDGIEHIAAELHSLPDGSVLYDHWLSWQWSFYLFDSRVYVSWFQGPDALSEDLIVHGWHNQRYIVTPHWESFTELEQAIHSAGFEASPIMTTRSRTGKDSFTLYRLLSTN